MELAVRLLPTLINYRVGNSSSKMNGPCLPLTRSRMRSPPMDLSLPEYVLGLRSKLIRAVSSQQTRPATARDPHFKQTTRSSWWDGMMWEAIGSCETVGASLGGKVAICGLLITLHVWGKVPPGSPGAMMRYYQSSFFLWLFGIHLEFLPGHSKNSHRAMELPANRPAPH